tara:strand:+ start:282 stop:569 length:288 start_codon:yes stop_codon:yes gene_type:complete
MTLITPKILTRIKACPEAIEYFTGSFCISGSQYHVSGSENDCEFEDGVFSPITCSNYKQVDWWIGLFNMFKVSGSIHDKETGFDYIVTGTKPNPS